MSKVLALLPISRKPSSITPNRAAYRMNRLAAGAFARRLPQRAIREVHRLARSRRRRRAGGATAKVARVCRPRGGGTASTKAFAEGRCPHRALPRRPARQPLLRVQRAEKVGAVRSVTISGSETLSTPKCRRTLRAGIQTRRWWPASGWLIRSKPAAKATVEQEHRAGDDAVRQAAPAGRRRPGQHRRQGEQVLSRFCLVKPSV